MNPEREFTLAEIAKHTQLKSSAVKKELAKLTKISLVKSKTVIILDTKRIAVKKPKRKIAFKKSHAKSAVKNKRTVKTIAKKRK